VWGKVFNLSTTSALTVTAMNATKTIDMGIKKICTLSYVESGGFNSGCGISLTGGRWHMTAVDGPPANGESQGCSALCLE
ncbi:hypothetical protein JTM30_34660, partial [Pseudomonas aeruginosa]|nr:hypothetical protein [Pseudomonas aeruginosa]